MFCGKLLNISMQKTKKLLFIKTKVSSFFLFRKKKSILSFYLCVVAGNNVLPEQTFRFNWAWISLELDKYIVNETEEYLYITLKRRGYLGETSFVGKKEFLYCQ